MRSLVVLGQIAGVVGLVVSAVASAQEERGPGPAENPVVLELFTSQGCSSCPPADALLTRLGNDPALAGAIVPLAFHVDYWDRLGWRDAFSQGAWSARQRAYAASVTSERIYTPEAVVGGRVECLGSDERCIREAVVRLRALPQVASVRLSFPHAGAAGPEQAIEVEVTARAQRSLPDGSLHVVVALVEDGLLTRVERGENAHRDLANDFVVRSLQDAFTLPAERPGELTRTVTLRVAPEWRREALSVVVFLQEPRSLRIRAAVRSALPVVISGARPHSTATTLAAARNHSSKRGSSGSPSAAWRARR